MNAMCVCLVARLQRDHGEHFLVWNMTRPDKALVSPKDFGMQVLDVTNFPLYVSIFIFFRLYMLFCSFPISPLTCVFL